MSLSIFYFSFMAVPESQEQAQQEVKKIDIQIQKLESEKKKHIEISRKYQKEGDRWQYNTGRIDDAHEAWGMANREREEALECQKQIDLLLEQKQKIYQIYPELASS